MDAVQSGADMPVLKEETGTALLNKLYGLSNAEEIIPEVINLLYSTIMANTERELVQTNLTWDEQTKAEVSEVISAICNISSVMEHADSLTTEEKETALDAIKALKDNEMVGKENYEALLNVMMGMK